ncbi:hypothetical protein Tco_0164676 [Tanacetum coccineum]
MLKSNDNRIKFHKSSSSTTIGDANPIRTLRDYSRPRHEGYRNTIELPKGNNMVPLRSNTIRIGAIGIAHSTDLVRGLQTKHSQGFLRTFVNLLDLDVANRERTGLHLFQFSLRDQASNWLERLQAGSIFT